jgi:hypothetical protein
MQHHTRRSTDQWRGFAALNPRNSKQPPTGHGSTRDRGACQHQHQAYHDRHADA